MILKLFHSSSSARATERRSNVDAQLWRAEWSYAADRGDVLTEAMYKLLELSEDGAIGVGGA